VSSVGHVVAAGSGPNVEGWLQAGEFGLALLLSAVIGLERELRQKSAGLRTHTLVGAGAALFMLISKYGFNDVLRPGLVMLDPSRVAAQIVTGVGFLGAGLIFVRQDAVRGLTTAASVWVTAAVGAAAGAGLPVLAGLATGAYLLIAVVVPPLTRRLPRSGTALSTLRVRYPDGRGILRDILELATQRGFAVDRLSTQHVVREPQDRDGVAGTVEVSLLLHGRGSVNDLAVALSDLPDVNAVLADDVNVPDAG
jgi:putative Mg2+ transporter-C (MgtC) family protein